MLEETLQKKSGACLVIFLEGSKKQRGILELQI